MARYPDLANYVKFLRGTPTAYHNLSHKDDDTLYFVAEKDATVGKLFLGNVEISHCLNEEGVVDYLSELKDVETSGVINRNLLGYDSKLQKWVPMSINDLVHISIMVGSTSTSDGIAGLVPAPKSGDETKFLSGDGNWTHVSANALTDLNAWVEAQRNTVPGLLSIKTEDNIAKALSDLDKLISNNTQQTSHINALNTKIDSIADKLTTYVSILEYERQMATITDDVTTLKEAVTWTAIE